MDDFDKLFTGYRSLLFNEYQQNPLPYHENPKRIDKRLFDADKKRRQRKQISIEDCVAHLVERAMWGKAICSLAKIDKDTN